MNIYNNAELDGRAKVEEYLKKNNISDYEFSINPDDHFDVIYISKKGNPILAEIKMRADSYANVNDMQIEEYKYNNVIKIANQLNCTPVYIFVYKTNNLIKIARLNDCNNSNLQFKKELQNKKTLEDLGKVEKSVAYITSYYTSTINNINNDNK